MPSKPGVVERDPKEQGERALLNLGHTIGHAVEKLMNFNLLHGQCVGIGLVAAAAISRERGLLTNGDTSRSAIALALRSAFVCGRTFSHGHSCSYQKGQKRNRDRLNLFL